MSEPDFETWPESAQTKRVPQQPTDQQRSEAVTEIRFGPNDLSQSEQERRAIAAGKRLADRVMLWHAKDCKVHEPTLRPCSCGLETRMRQLIAYQSAAIAERDATIAALQARVAELEAENLEADENLSAIIDIHTAEK